MRLDLRCLTTIAKLRQILRNCNVDGNCAYYEKNNRWGVCLANVGEYRLNKKQVLKLARKFSKRGRIEQLHEAIEGAIK